MNVQRGYFQFFCLGDIGFGGCPPANSGALFKEGVYRIQGASIGMSQHDDIFPYGFHYDSVVGQLRGVYIREKRPGNR